MLLALTLALFAWLIALIVTTVRRQPHKLRTSGKVFVWTFVPVALVITGINIAYIATMFA